MQGNDRTAARRRRHRRVRKKVLGTAACPRLAVFRSARHIYAQLIDDVAASTVVSASSNESVVSASTEGGKTGVAAAVGKLLAERASEKNVTKVVFDRGGYKYHGRVAALADAARDGGLVF